MRLDSNIVQAIPCFFSRYLVVDGESRRIGVRTCRRAIMDLRMSVLTLGVIILK